MGILRDIFGPSKNEVWQALCSEIGGEFIDGGFWGGTKVKVRSGEWTIVLDTFNRSSGKSSTPYTRIRAPYVNPDGFKFKIYNENIFTDIGKLFALQDITVGFPEFDNRFIIKGNDETKVKELFADSELRGLIDLQPSILLQVKDDEGIFGAEFPEGVDELYFEVMGVIKDMERLKSLFDLFGEVLNRLCIIGSAYKDDPNVNL